MVKGTVEQLVLLGAALILCCGVIVSCSGTGPTVVDVPAYEPDTESDITVDLPEPEPVEPPEQRTRQQRPETVTRVVYTVSPEEGYQTGKGYVRIEYEPEDKGTIIIHLGHKEIERANTKWYSYMFEVNGKKYTKKGKNTVPFVRGRNNYWWNEDEFHVSLPVQQRGLFSVIDEYAGTVHRFIIEREEIIVQKGSEE